MTATHSLSQQKVNKGRIRLHQTGIHSSETAKSKTQLGIIKTWKNVIKEFNNKVDSSKIFGIKKNWFHDYDNFVLWKKIDRLFYWKQSIR